MPLILQCVSGPTHVKGHTLDLVLSFGLSVSVHEICDSACISDHLPVLFTLSFPGAPDKPTAPASRRRAITPLTASQFSAIFDKSCPWNMSDNLSADQLLSIFNFSCTAILDTVAPFRLKRPKTLSEPWLNDSTRALRRLCRQAERKWKKDKLTVSLEVLHACLSDYQRAVKTAKTAYFSAMVSNNSHKPQVLFNVLNSLLNPRVNSPVVPSPNLCDNFLNFFINKVSSLRPGYTNVMPTFDPAPVPCPAVLDQFEPVSLHSLSDVIKRLRPTNCPTDSIPSRLLKEVFDSVGSCVLQLINTSLSTGQVPGALKHAVVKPLIKKKKSRPLHLG